MRIGLATMLLWSVSPSDAAPVTAHPSVPEIVALADSDQRTEHIMQRMMAASDNPDARNRWGAALVVCRELEDASPAVLSAYLSWAMSHSEADRTQAIEGARAGGHLSPEGQPTVPVKAIDAGETLQGAPTHGDPTYPLFEAYKERRLSLACVSTDAERSTTSVVLNAIIAANSNSMPDGTNTTWGVVRGETIIVGMQVVLALESAGLVDHGAHCPNNERRKCFTLAEAEVLVPRYNQMMRDQVGLTEDQVMTLEINNNDKTWQRCIPRYERTIEPSKKPGRAAKGPKDLGDEPL